VWRWIEHTGEAALAVEASSEEGVFADALLALAELLADEGQGPATRFEVGASAPDRAALLADWLSELLFLAETESFVPERLERLELSDTSLSATVSGHIGHPSPLVKAVTYHDLVLEPVEGGWRARVVLDV
jgi:SHS2 domain-containing protein